MPWARSLSLVLFAATLIDCGGIVLDPAADDERGQVWVIADGAPTAIPYPGDWQ